jgi:hypothetical protein
MDLMLFPLLKYACQSHDYCLSSIFMQAHQITVRRTSQLAQRLIS